jgi:hypothetical protein
MEDRRLAVAVHPIIVTDTYDRFDAGRGRGG